VNLEDLFVVPLDRSFNAVYGHVSIDATHARVAVAPQLLGAHGAVHSGVYAAIAETIASTGTAVEMLPQGFMVSGLSNATYVLADVRAGTLEAAATCRARAEGEWLWDVEIRAGETLAAQATVVIAVRPAGRPAPPPAE
jgi:acyl-coenzyme A thioesterase PaaI-like protein